MIEQKEIGAPPNWCALTVTGGWEIQTVRRISEAGFIAHCPVYSKKYRVRGRAPNLFRIKSEPLFPTYIFLQHDPNFRKAKFETTRVSLSRVRGGWITPGEITQMNLLAYELTSACEQSTLPSQPITKNEILQIIHGDRVGDRVKALEVLRHRIQIEFLDRPEWKGRHVWINRTALGKAI